MQAALLSLENVFTAGVDAVQTPEDNIVAPQWLSACDPAGVEDRGMHTWGFSATWEALPISTDNCRKRIPDYQPQACVTAFRCTCIEIETRPWYRQAKETKRGGKDDRDSE